MALKRKVRAGGKGRVAQRARDKAAPPARLSSAANPLRTDPTRTATLRRQFQTAIARRFARLKLALVKLVAEEDAFGLGGPPLLAGTPLHTVGPRGGISGLPTANQRWRFQGTADQVRAFRGWLADQLGETVTSQTDRELWERYTQAAFMRGAARSYDDARRLRTAAGREPPVPAGVEGLAYLGGQKGEFLRQAQRNSALADKVRLLTERSFSDLEGVTEGMASAIARTLADGLVRGVSPRELARDMARQVDVGKERAQLISRTELIRAHAEAQLDALEAMGVTDVGVQVEWATAGDDRVCARCEQYEGVVLSVEEARGRIPVHVQCRCAWIPSVLGPEPGRERGASGEGVSAVEQAALEGAAPDFDEEELEFVISRRHDLVAQFDALWRAM